MRKILLVGLLFLLSPHSGFAAFSGLYLSHSPEIVQPRKPVVVTASVVDRSESNLEYTWSVDGKVVANAAGQTSLEVIAPEAGIELEVSVEVRDGMRVYATERLLLRPATLYLESDATSSAPPFYIGKRLPSPQGEVTFSAIPNFITSNGTRLPADSLLYEWRVNGAQKIKPSLGKSSATFTVPFFNKPFTVTATASSRDGTLRAQESTLVTPASPDVVVYEMSPLSGILDQRAVRNEYLLTTEEVTLLAYPLYTKNVADIAFNWSLNGFLVDLPDGDSRSVTFRKTAEGSGSYRVSVDFSNPLLFLERAARSFLLQF